MNIFKRLWNYFFGVEPETETYDVIQPKEFEQEKQIREAWMTDEVIELGKESIKEFKEKEAAVEKPIDPISIRNNLFPERFEGESREEYKKRQLLAKEFLKRKKKGTLVYQSKVAILDKVGKVKAFTKGKTFKGDTSKLKII